MEDRARARERRPLRHGFEMIHRLARLDLDQPFETAASIRRAQHEVGKHDVVREPGRRVFLIPRVDADLVLTFKLRLEESNHTVVLELLAYRAHQNRAHRASGRQKVRGMDGTAYASTQ